MSRKEEVGSFVNRKIYFLQKETGLGNSNAALANLRRGIGYEPGELPQLFGIVLLDFPEKFMSENGVATKEEWACYVALTLYALHQQGYDIKNQSMHIEQDESVGAAMLKFALSNEDSNAEQRMLQRLQRLATSIDRKELAYHLRGIIQLLRTKGIPMNYGRLAKDLYEIQFSEGKKQVCLKWGQDFYKRTNKKGEKENDNE